MTTSQKQEMTVRIVNQVSKLTAKGMSYERSIEVVFDDMNKRWPLAMEAYCNA